MKYDTRAVAKQIRTAMIYHTHFISLGGTKREKEVYGIVLSWNVNKTGIVITVTNSKDGMRKVQWNMPRTDVLAVMAEIDQLIAAGYELNQFEFAMWDEDDQDQLEAADATWNLQHPPCSTCGCSTFSGNCPMCDAPIA
jgi:hypothetical protein